MSSPDDPVAANAGGAAAVPSTVAVPLPLARLPIDILHVSDSHFLGLRNARRRKEWDIFLDSVSEGIDKKTFLPQLIAFTGDLVESPGRPGAERAFRNGVAALVDLAVACKFVQAPPPASTWTNGVPPQWRALLNRRLLMVPGNHDVFFKGLRICKQHFPRRFRDLVSTGKEPAATSIQLGPLAVRLIDTNGGPAFFKRARGVYDASGDGAKAWPFDTSGLFPIALMHGHPLQLPYLLEGIDSETGMMIENAGSLLHDLAALGVRLVLHGHRHLPNVCGVTVNVPDREAHSITVVAAGSVTAPAKQWPYFGYNRVRIEPDRRVTVQLMKRDEGQRRFSPVDAAPRVVHQGDFEYDHAERVVRITELGDECNTIRVHGFKIRTDRPDVHSIPFGVATHAVARLAAARFVSTRNGVAARPALEWDRQNKIIRIRPPHTDGDDPLDLEFSYCIHNSSPRSQWEARALRLGELVRDVVSERRMCTTRRVTMEVWFPSAFDTLAQHDFTADIEAPDGSISTAACEWDPQLRKVSFAIERPRVGSKLAIRWTLPSGEPTAEEEGRIQPVRAWQAELARMHYEGRRPLDDVCTQLKQQLAAKGSGGLDVALFLVCTSEVLARLPGIAATSGLLLVGECADVPLAGPTSLAYGEGVAGRALRTGTTVWFNRLVAQESLRRFQGGNTSEPPENFYVPVDNDRNYDALLAVPVDLNAFATAGRPCSPQWTTLVASLATRDAASPLLRADARGREWADMVSALTVSMLREVVDQRVAGRQSPMTT